MLGNSSMLIRRSRQGEEPAYVYTAFFSTEQSRGNWQLSSGEHGTTTAVYTNGTLYMYYCSTYGAYWCISDTVGKANADFCKSASSGITGTWEQMFGSGQAPVMREYEAPKEAVENYYSAAGGGEAQVNGTYRLYKGTHGGSDAIYTNGSMFMYTHYSGEKGISTDEFCCVSHYYSMGSLTSSWYTVSGAGTDPAPTVTAV